jgi:hypothetical protein
MTGAWGLAAMDERVRILGANLRSPAENTLALKSLLPSQSVLRSKSISSKFVSLYPRKLAAILRNLSNLQKLLISRKYMLFWAVLPLSRSFGQLVQRGVSTVYTRIPRHAPAAHVRPPLPGSKPKPGDWVPYPPGINTWSGPQPQKLLGPDWEG